MEQEAEKLINFLKQIREHPSSFFGYQNDLLIVRAYLSGMRTIALKLLGFNGTVGELVGIEDAAASRRGYSIGNASVISALKDKGLPDNEIVTELIQTEIEFWSIYSELLGS